MTTDLTTADFLPYMGVRVARLLGEKLPPVLHGAEYDQLFAGRTLGAPGAAERVLALIFTSTTGTSTLHLWEVKHPGGPYALYFPEELVALEKSFPPDPPINTCAQLQGMMNPVQNLTAPAPEPDPALLPVQAFKPGPLHCHCPACQPSHHFTLASAIPATAAAITELRAEYVGLIARAEAAYDGNELAAYDKLMGHARTSDGKRRTARLFLGDFKYQAALLAVDSVAIRSEDLNTNTP